MDAAAVGAARQAIEAADPADPATLDELNANARFTAAGEAAARAILVDGTAGTDTLWAAVWVYGSTGTDPTPLRPFADNADPSIRAMAGAALIALGDPAGFPALRASLASTLALRGAHPARAIRAFALGALAGYVDAADLPASPASAESVGTAAGEWSAWLETNAAALRWDGAAGMWRLA